MYVEYHDILSRIRDRPLWWHRGTPRYDAFNPGSVSVYARQVALVHTQCQACDVRYDVAVLPDQEWNNLRDRLAYTNELGVGDPPNALHHPIGCAGPTMNSIEIEILEFWEKQPILQGWNRVEGLERSLAGKAWIETDQFDDSVMTRIHASDRKQEWMEAMRGGDFGTMVAVLEHFECERPREVAHMLDSQRLQRDCLNHRVALHRERFSQPD